MIWQARKLEEKIEKKNARIATLIVIDIVYIGEFLKYVKNKKKRKKKSNGINFDKIFYVVESMFFWLISISETSFDSINWKR